MGVGRKVGLVPSLAPELSRWQETELLKKVKEQKSKEQQKLTALNTGFDLKIQLANYMDLTEVSTSRETRMDNVTFPVELIQDTKLSRH